ncbi:hypothetical protein BGZ65_011586, partial [Modicella reniformis]
EFVPSLSTLFNLDATGTMNEATYQEFRTRKSSDITAIPTRNDPKTKQQVVRWKDIQQCFENAKNVMIGKAAVLFLTDDELE